MTATVEAVAEQLDLASIMPSEKVVSAVARSVTLTDSDVGNVERNRRAYYENSNIFFF